MLTSGISFVNFKKKNKSLKIRKNLQSIINDKNEILNSLSKNYKDNWHNYLERLKEAGHTRKKP